jgi:signal peptidase I
VKSASEQDQTKPVGNKPRRWWTAGLLSLIRPGLGQIYNGQARKGLTLLLLSPLLVLVASLVLDADNVVLAFMFIIAIGICWYVYAIFDAVITAWRLRVEYVPHKFNKAIVYAGTIAAFLIAEHWLFGSLSPQYIKQNYLQAYRIPSTSMKPTLLAGDYILVDRRPAARTPKRGDLVVFEYPVDPKKDFIKRIVAVGGDTVLIKDKGLFVNDSLQIEPYAIHEDTTIFTAAQSPRDNFGPVNVPNASFFVMGDNRDHSYDSQFWGFVEQSRIKGIAKGIYWSRDNDKGVIRFDRIGYKIK